MNSTLSRYFFVFRSFFQHIHLFPALKHVETTRKSPILGCVPDFCSRGAEEKQKKTRNESSEGCVQVMSLMRLRWIWSDWREYAVFNIIKKLVCWIFGGCKDLGSMELKFVKNWEVERTFSDLREQMWSRGWFPLLKWRACIIISPIISELLLSTMAISPDATPKWRVNSKRSHIPGYAKCVFITLTFL